MNDSCLPTGRNDEYLQK